MFPFAAPRLHGLLACCARIRAVISRSTVVWLIVLGVVVMSGLLIMSSLLYLNAHQWEHDSLEKDFERTFNDVGHVLATGTTSFLNGMPRDSCPFYRV